MLQNKEPIFTSQAENKEPIFAPQIENKEPIFIPQVENKEQMQIGNKGPTFSPQIKNTIRELVKELEHLPNLGEKISERVNKKYATKFTPTQISQ
jgi:hypothetical protein